VNFRLLMPLIRCHVVAHFARKIAIKCVFSCQNESDKKAEEKRVFTYQNSFSEGMRPARLERATYGSGAVHHSG
jgi:hypothetical protein